jgi:hypothetical protein
MMADCIIVIVAGEVRRNCSELSPMPKDRIDLPWIFATSEVVDKAREASSSI